jgi:3-carboxy-cis,cis-muconate cycloisomerase
LPSEPRASGLFAPVFVSDAIAATTSDEAWLQAMLDFEAALAAAEADAGVINAADAEAIAAACRTDGFDVDELGRAARLGGNPVIPLVRALGERVEGDAVHAVHWGATSQDVLDTAAMLVTARSFDVIAAELAALATSAADLAERHRHTLLPARTLLQHALPTTFGLKAAGWLTAALQVADRLAWARDERLAVELGGAAGTLASLGPDGPAVVAGVARRLGLAEPLLPWHTDRTRIADIAAVLGQVAGVAGKIAIDVALLTQTEVAEAFEPAGPGRGGSSTLPHKRNPVGAASAAAAARRAHALVGVLYGAMVQEHERAVGAWQAEWPALTELLQLAGGAVAHMREVVGGLELDTERMRANLDLTRGAVLAERAALRLTPDLGRARARQLVEEASARAAKQATSLRDELAASSPLDAPALDELFDPAGYLGATPSFIDAALAAYRSREPKSGAHG